MMTDDKAALLERAANALRESAERADADGQVGTADKDFAASLACAAWADELRAEPPWLDAPDGPGEWWGGPDGEEATLCRFGVLSAGTLWAMRGHLSNQPLWLWMQEHHGWRYRRRTPVIVPPRETTQ